MTARLGFGSPFLVGLFFCRFVAAGGANATPAVAAHPSTSTTPAVAARPSVSTTPAVTHPSGGQGALAVGFDASGGLRARVCPGEPCGTDGGKALGVPPEAARLASGARLRAVRLGLERTAVVVEIPDAPNARTWTAIVAAPLSGAEPLVAFSDYTGLVQGVEGERSGPTVLVREEAVYVGVTREDRDLCGRPALLSPRVLDPSTLTLLPAKLQRLSETERAAAPRLVASRAEGEAPPSLLRAQWATSTAEGAPVAALTDGNLETAWAEGRGGVGRGEAIVMRSPREVPLAAFELAVPDSKKKTAAPGPATGAAAANVVAPAPPLLPPKEVWLATDHELFHVTLPDDAGAKGAGRYTIALPAPVQTSCVALVLESASSERRDAAIGVAELQARPAAGGTTEELVKQISGSGPEAEVAAAILRSSGDAGFTAVAAAFDGLAEDGRRVALDVLDDAPCAVALPAYVTALGSAVEGQREHARSALPRCGVEGPAAIVRAMTLSPGPTRLALADELVSVAPGAAIPALLPLLVGAREKERRAYRVIIGRAARSADGREALRRAFEQTDLSPAVTLELLRAAGDVLSSFGDAARRAFARISTDTSPFRLRFLLLGPAAELSEEDGGARSFLRSALIADKSPYVRAEAARVLRTPRPFYAELSRAAEDTDVRVREAAVVALGVGRIDEAADRLVYRLGRDPWPFVRASAARSLAALGPNAAADTALRSAITEDEAPDVRRAAVIAVGVRRVTAAAKVVRDRFQDRQELDSVRGAAALALGMMCDAASADALTEQAVRLVSPTADETERRVAESALAALGLLHPADLARRVAPLTAKTVPGPMRRLATAALAAKGRCGAAPQSPAR